MSSFDHYYARTALLAGQGLRIRMRRIVTLTIVCLGTIPLLLTGTPAGPQGIWRWFGVSVMVGGLLMAWWWWRRQWPTRTQSWLVVSIGTGGIAAICIMMSDPVVGLLGSASFSLITTYTAFLHSRRVLFLTWVASAIVVAYLAVRVAVTDLWLGACGAVVALLIVVSTSAMVRMAVRLIDRENVKHPDEIDPLTGLLNRAAFNIHAATMLGSHSRHDDQYLVILAIGIDDMTLLSDMDGADSTVHARVAVGQALRETVRHRVPLAHISDTEFLIADVFKTNDPSPLVDRIRIALTTTPMRLTASIGTACSPLRPLTALPAEQVVDDFVDLAVRAMNQSRAAGGNQTTYAHFPTPTLGPDAQD
ncbi:GGDEF domain-containing protein [Mycobacterium frederiksbergense]|uniref:GGDEF domain-containing protein n=1 Tax=Mycolicibacterium frederiksbergense TaxID=117567 RepID=A0ABT6KU90_9MYCO|nr:GGDEF domain-containing protein [Mycolicibacterium frederiksbergense]MDH6193547.1 GGDEF domain-containing protein [Mycolicibacterium frederiksbergense]